MAADPVEVDAKHFRVELENDRVRVLRASYGPGERSVMHAHPAMVTVSLKARDLKFTLPDGRTQHMLGKAGEVAWYDPHEHLPENLSSSSYEAVLIELKG
jgi:quercetin dioxygenase-like cupin family protein